MKTTTSMVLKAWENQNKIITGFFSKYEDDFYNKEVAPGRNRAIYLFGHLIGMNDLMHSLLDLGDPIFPQLEAIFVTSPDKSVAEIPSIATLRSMWETLNTTLAEHFNKLDTDNWLSRHTKVSEADFLLEPTRNKLNILMSRVNHMNYHMGQLALIVPKG